MAVTAESVVAPPGWFNAVIAKAPEYREVRVDGGAVRLRCCAAGVGRDLRVWTVTASCGPAIRSRAGRMR